MNPQGLLMETLSPQISFCVLQADVPNLLAQAGPLVLLVVLLQIQS